MTKQIIAEFDEGEVILLVEDNGQVHCVVCGKLLDVTLAELDGCGSAPVCEECAGIPIQSQ